MTRGPLLLSLWLGLASVADAPAWALPTREAGPGVAANAPVLVLRWRTFAPPGGRFSVLLPTPRSKSIAVPSGVGYLYTCKAGDLGYIVQYNDSSPDIVRDLGAKKVLMIFDNAFLHAGHKRLVRRSLVTRGGYPGERIDALRSRCRQERSCAYLVGNRLYRLVALCPTGDSEAQADADNFLNSFTPTPAAPPKPAR